jgi:hypothetical protein
MTPHDYKYLNTVADASTIFMYARMQKEALMARATMGTPLLSVLAITRGADPESAKAYRVRDAI